MPLEPFSHTREQIHAAVWAEPMRDACKRFGVSDVALAKICRRLNVPRPQQGYWVRLMMGTAPEKKALPAASPGAPTKWEGKRWVDSTPTSPANCNAAAARDPAVDQPIVVAEVLDDLHPALLGSMKALKGAGKGGGDVRHQQPCAAILTSPPQLDRALRIMNALFRALESRGLRIELTAPSKEKRSYGGEVSTPSMTGVHVDESFIRFEIVEGHDVVEIPAPKPVKTKRPSIFDRPRFTPPPKIEHRPNGKLVLQILDGSYGFRKKWSDGAYRRIEDCLNSVVETIVRTGGEMRRERLERERWHREWEEEKRQRQEAERKRREEEARVEKLRAALSAWGEVRDVRAFVQEAHAIAAAAGSRINFESAHGKFLSWATKWSNQMDPFLDLRREIAAAVADPTEQAAGAK